jgi:hypothetical protein
MVIGRGRRREHPMDTCTSKSTFENFRLVFLVYFRYCEDLLIIPDLKYLYCDMYILMNYLFNPYISFMTSRYFVVHSPASG